MQCKKFFNAVGYIESVDKLEESVLHTMTPKQNTQINKKVIFK